MAENDVVTNDQMMNDFFSFDDIELPDNLSSEQQQSSQPDLNANTATNPNQQQQLPAQQQPANPGNQQQLPPNQQQQQTLPEGFEQSFFKDDGKGNQVINIDSAMSFLTKQNAPNVDNQLPNYRQMAFQPQQPAQQPEQPQQPEKQLNVFDQIEQYAENLRANVLGGYEKAIAVMQRQGLWNAENIDAVNLSKEYENLKSSVEQNIREKRSQLFTEYENKRNQAGKEEDAFKTIRERADTNRLAQYNNLGGKDKFEQLIFGTEVNGKLVGGYGTDVINHMIDIAYEFSGKEFPKDRQEMQKAYNDFYTRICAKPERLQHLVEMAETRVAKALLPQIRDAIRANKEAEIQQRSRAQQMSPSQIQTPQNQGQMDSLGDYLGHDWRNSPIDTI